MAGLTQHTTRTNFSNSSKNSRSSRARAPFPSGQSRRCSSSSTSTTSSSVSRREQLLGQTALLLSVAGLAAPRQPAWAAAAGIEVLSDEPGVGRHPVGAGDLALVHYIGTLPDGQVFDSTRGGLKYRDGGPGVFRPVVIRLNGAPQPGICEGLSQALLGLTIGGKRSVKVPPELGFGDKAVLAPYAVVPGGSTLQYDIELVRVSSVGPDLLVKGISRCGAGGASATADNCAAIRPAEFF